MIFDASCFLSMMRHGVSPSEGKNMSVKEMTLGTFLLASGGTWEDFPGDNPGNFTYFVFLFASGDGRERFRNWARGSKIHLPTGQVLTLNNGDQWEGEKGFYLRLSHTLNFREVASAFPRQGIRSPEKSWEGSGKSWESSSLHGINPQIRLAPSQKEIRDVIMSAIRRSAGGRSKITLEYEVSRRWPQISGIDIDDALETLLINGMLSERSGIYFLKYR